MSEKLQTVLASFEGVTQTSASSWKAFCPAHSDESDPSLQISIVTGKILLHCFAGCRTKDVLDVAGLEWRDLFDETLDGESVPVAARKATKARAEDEIDFRHGVYSRLLEALP